MKQTLRDYDINLEKHLVAQSFLRSFTCFMVSKKQNSVALSTIKAKYIAAGSCYAQSLWMKQTLRDYDINLEQIPIMCDNTNANKSIKKSHRTKHIEIRHHFLRDHVKKEDVMIKFVSIENQLVDIFIKPFNEVQFIKIRY